MSWKQPHISKVYEALTALADDRIEIDAENPNKAKCLSSSKGKFYEIEYDPETGAMMSNDNSAFFTDSLSYPMIAFLMLKGKIPRPEYSVNALKGIKWKDINQKFKRNYDKAVTHILAEAETKGRDIEKIQEEVSEVYAVVKSLQVPLLGPKKFPPRGY